MDADQTGAEYTLLFKMEAIRLVKNGQSAAVVAKVLGVPQGALEDWIRSDNDGSLNKGEDKVISQ